MRGSYLFIERGGSRVERADMYGEYSSCTFADNRTRSNGARMSFRQIIRVGVQTSVFVFAIYKLCRYHKRRIFLASSAEAACELRCERLASGTTQTDHEQLLLRTPVATSEESCHSC